MKKILISCIVFIFLCCIPALTNNNTTKYTSAEQEKKGCCLSKITGIDFISKKIAENIIEKQLKKEFNSKMSAELEIFSAASLKKGEFKSLKIKCKKLKYNMFRISDFEAQTVFPYNKTINKKGKIYYPEDLILNYKGTITNNDLKAILQSESFQDELNKKRISGVEINTPDVTIQEGKIYFTIPITTIFSKKPIYLKLSTKANIENHKFVLTDISFLAKNNIIKSNKIESILKEINPLAYQLKPIDTKFCKIYVSNVKIDNDIIITEGTFIINKNYSE